MLGSLDTLLSLAGIMLGLSLVITVINQSVSNALGLRGSALRWGLLTMFNELYRDEMLRRSNRTTSSIPHIDKVVDFILKHPLITDSTMPLDWAAFLESAVHGDGSKKQSKTGSRVLARVSRFLEWFNSRWRSATALTFDEFARILKLGASAAIPDSSFDKLDQWRPVHAITYLNRNPLVTPDWFESTMRRTRQRFAMSMRLCTIACSCLLVFFLHVDTFQIFKSLAAQPESVAKFNAQLDQLKATQAEGAELQQLESIKQGLRISGLQVLPENLSAHFPISLRKVTSVSGAFTAIATAFGWLVDGEKLKHVAGMLVTMVLLSLGAPFWFNQLKNISTLRTAVAQTTDTAKPQTTQKSLVSVQDGDGL